MADRQKAEKSKKSLQRAIAQLSLTAGPQLAAHFRCFNKTWGRQQAAVNDMLVCCPPLCNTFRISHNGQLPVSPAFISSMRHWTVKLKDTWHHMFPSAVMTAPSAAFMAAGLWRLSDRGRVQVSIRGAARRLPCLPEAAFTPLTPPWCRVPSPCAAILKNACWLQLEIYNKIREGCWEERGRRRRGAAEWGQRAKRREHWEKQNERDRDEDRERGRERRGRPKACGVHHHFAWLRCD